MKKCPVCAHINNDEDNICAFCSSLLNEIRVDSFDSLSKVNQDSPEAYVSAETPSAGTTTPANESPANESPANESPVNESPANESPVNESPVNQEFGTPMAFPEDMYVSDPLPNPESFGQSGSSESVSPPNIPGFYSQPDSSHRTGANGQDGPFRTAPVNYIQPDPGGMRAQLHSKATAALVLGILGTVFSFCCGIFSLILSILAIVFGNEVKKKAHAFTDMKSDRDIAFAGVVLGWIGVGLSALMLIIGTVPSIISALSNL